jgi:plasmid rolling circle replication initiator protein Rep
MHNRCISVPAPERTEQEIGPREWPDRVEPNQERGPREAWPARVSRTSGRRPAFSRDGGGGRSPTPTAQPPRAKAAEGLQFLAADSPGDETWDKHRAYGDQLAEMLTAAAMPGPAVRVRDCAEALFFQLRADAGTGELSWKLKSAPFCRFRHCPICQWRRSMRTKATVMSALPTILQQYPTARFVLLTLTIRNCSITDLRQTILAMNRGWQRLIQRADWPALGWIRGVEVTAGKDCTAHPHFHALLMLPASYFSGRAYVPTKEWVQRWRQVMRLDYDPMCDIRVIKVKPGSQVPTEGTDARLLAISSSVSEVAKYATETEDLMGCGPDWLREYVAQVNALKFLTSGGALKGILKDVRKKDDEDEDLVHVDGEEPADGEVEDLLSYHWRRKLKRYARKREGGE